MLGKFFVVVLPIIHAVYPYLQACNNLCRYICCQLFFALDQGWNQSSKSSFAHVRINAYRKKPSKNLKSKEGSSVSRELRVKTNRSKILNFLNSNQREFVQYVLQNYIDIGVDELDISKLSTVVRAKYGSINAAQESLGTVEEIKEIFIDFQKNLYIKISA